jgi:hypothetical protein
LNVLVVVLLVDAGIEAGVDAGVLLFELPPHAVNPNVAAPTSENTVASLCMLLPILE